MTFSAQAADPYAPPPPEVPDAVEARDIIFDLGFGAQLQPQFPSSQKYMTTPWPIAGLHFLRVPMIGDVVDGKPRVFSIYPAYDFTGERKESDAAYLAGTGKVDWSVELGPGVAFRKGPIRAFAEIRYGLSGHNGFVGEAGVDFIANQFARFEVRGGPRVSLATDDYMKTYFGVPVSAAVLDPYEPSGGFKDVGIEMQALYRITDKLSLRGKASWRHYVGDAADSPIVKAGNQDEFVVGIGLSYLFGLDLY
nr:MipA/OmpV family protein [Acuticoccus kalidii]